NLVRGGRDVAHSDEAAAGLVVRDAVGLPAEGGVRDRVIAQDAAVAGGGVERDDIVQKEDRERGRRDALPGQRRQQRRGQEVVPPVDLERARPLATSRLGAELGR